MGRRKKTSNFETKQHNNKIEEVYCYLAQIFVIHTHTHTHTQEEKKSPHLIGPSGCTGRHGCLENLRELNLLKKKEMFQLRI